MRPAGPADVVVAVDGGGTSTRCVVAARTGDCLGYARTGSGNPVSAGADRAAEAFAQAIGAALAQAGADPAAVTTLLFSMAGGLTGNAATAFAGRLRALGLTAAPVVVGDLIGVYCSGAYELAGYTLESGTGSGAIRVEGGQSVATSDGLGWLLGDDGSAFWIGHQVARAVCEQLDRRGPATSLTAPVLADLGLPEDLTPSWSGRAAVLDDAIRVVYALRPVELSRLARLAFAAAGDAVADRILAEAAARLATTLVSLVTPDVAGPVVVGGSVLTKNPAFTARVQALVTPHFPAPPEFRIVQDGAVGATVLALRRSGVQVGQEVFTRIQDTLRPLAGHRHRRLTSP